MSANTPENSDLEARVSELERQNRGLKILIVGLALAFGFLGGVAATLYLRHDLTSLTAREFHLTDPDGNLIAALAPDENGEPDLSFFAPDGTVTWEANAPEKPTPAPSPTPAAKPSALQPAAAPEPKPPAPAPQPGSALNPPKPAPAGSPGDQNVIVYISKSGTHYHLATCRSVAQTKTPISLADAKKRGFLPCSICKPPK